MEEVADSRQQCCSCGTSSRCWCVDCNEALCDVCVSAHRRVTVTRTHKILNQPPAGDVSSPPIKYCRLHPSEPLQLYCFTCYQLTCRDCQLSDHMTHRYLFVKQALAQAKKTLETRIQPIRVQGDRVKQSLLDMETRLQEIAHSEARLKMQLQKSYTSLVLHLKKRMEDILKQVKTVSEAESKRIRRRKHRMKQLKHNQQLVLEIAEKARTSSDVSALRNYVLQVESQLKNLPDEDSTPPQIMSELKVVTDRSSLDAILNFGSLQVLWVPFSVSQTTEQNPPVASSSSPLTLTCPALPSKPLPQTRTTSESSVPVNSSSTSFRSLCPSSSNVTPTTSTCSAPTCGTVPADCPSTSWKSSFNQLNPPPSSKLNANQSDTSITDQSRSHIANQSNTPIPNQSNTPIPNQSNTPIPNQSITPIANQSNTPVANQSNTPIANLSNIPIANQSNAPIANQSSTPIANQSNTPISNQSNTPIATTTTVTSAVQHPSSTLSQLEKKNSMQVVVINPVQPVSTGLLPSAGPSQILQLVQPSLVLNQPTGPRRDQVAAAAPLTITQTMYQMSCLPSVVPQFPMLLNQAPPGNTWSKQQRCLMGTIIPGQFSPTSVIPPVTPFAATTGNQISLRPIHKAPHPPTMTSIPPSSSQRLTLEPDPSLHSSSSVDQPQQNPVVRALADSACDRNVQQVTAQRQEPAENEPTSTMSEDPAPAGKPSAPQKPEPDPEVLDKEAEELELEPAVLDKVAEESGPEPEVLDKEAEEPGRELEVLDKEAEEPGPELEVLGTETEEHKPEPEVFDSKGDEPELEVLDSEGDEPEPEVSDSKGDEPEPEVSDSKGDEPELEVLDSEGDEPEPEVSDSKGDETEPEVLDSEGDEAEPQVLDSECDESEPQVLDSESDEPEPQVLDSESDVPEPEISDREGDQPEPEALDSDGNELELEVSDSEGDELELEVSDSEGDELEPEVSDSEGDELEPEPEVLDSKAEGPRSMIVRPVETLRQWQPSVSLFRLPVSWPGPGHPLPRFSLVAGDAEDEFYLLEMENTQSHAGGVTDDIITELPSSPESPPTMEVVTCCACQSGNSSIICSHCGRGYHRDCHLPPVGPDLRSEWMCSLCQDLSDPTDPFSSDRPPRPRSPSLSLQDQRRCESLLLYLKVEGCTHLSQSLLTEVSERLMLRRSPPYPTASEFLLHIWSLFKDVSQDDDVLIRLRDSVRSHWIGVLGPQLRNSNGGKPAVTPPLNSNVTDGEQAAESFTGLKVETQEQEVGITSKSRLKETRKRLRELLGQVETSRNKKVKTDNMLDRQSPS